MLKTKHTGGRLTQSALILALTAPMSAAASLEIHRAERAEPKSYSAAPAFDNSQYTVIADNQYSSVIEHGQSRSFQPAPSYADPMSLHEALELLLPDQWVALRNRDTREDIRVSWDIDSGNWIDVIRNLGERHGLQFHVDYNQSRVYVREGRQLLVEPESDIDRLRQRRSRGGQERIESNPVPSRASSRNTSSHPRSNENHMTFDLFSGDNGEEVMDSLGALTGFDDVYWMTDSVSVGRTREYQGSPHSVLRDVSAALQIKACVYDQDNVMAIVSAKEDCPQ